MLAFIRDMLCDFGEKVERIVQLTVAGYSLHKFRPWELDVAIAFTSRERAAEFEKYLKSHSGRAFAAKHF
ncbi:MAG: hypothetical protein JW902_12610 [Syntrophaceae bacterium]|nr:hypothetical protein [Syntrophaceae bacterium]